MPIVVNARKHKDSRAAFHEGPTRGEEYRTYLKFLTIKGTRFQTRAISSFDQDSRASKDRENFSWGSILNDLNAKYFDVAVAQRPSRDLYPRVWPFISLRLEIGKLL